MRITQQSFWLDADETLYWHVTCPRCQWLLNLSSWRFALSMAWMHIESHRALGHCTVSATNPDRSSLARTHGARR